MRAPLRHDVGSQLRQRLTIKLENSCWIGPGDKKRQPNNREDQYGSKCREQCAHVALKTMQRRRCMVHGFLFHVAAMHARMLTKAKIIYRMSTEGTNAQRISEVVPETL